MSETDPRETSAEPPAGREPARTGPSIIAALTKTLPASPGVYRMLNLAGEVIYAGKARSLKARVSSYTRLAGHSSRIARMISQTASMEFVTVATEAEALLLEANLIKRFRPRFNVTMRDDKSFPFILIARDHRAPRITKHRGARDRPGNYYGPFASAGAVSRTVTMLQRAFLLRSCSDSVYETRTRPCLLHQIKRCSAPCTGEIGLDDYGLLVEEAARFLGGDSAKVRALYQRLMADAAERLDFEQAARFRDRLWALAHVTAGQTINPEGVNEADVFAAHQEGGATCVQVFFLRAGQNWGNRAYYPKADPALAVDEVLASFVAQFYDDKPVPRLILLSHEVAERGLLAEALAIKASRGVAICVPRRGKKSALVAHALANAREALGRRLAESSSQRALLDALAERFGLPQTPRRIEVFDNSHIAGSDAVGAMIVAGREGFVKSAYRKFNIKSLDLSPGDDYGMMREVLSRRFRRLAVEELEVASADPPLEGNGDLARDDDSAFPDRPDVVLIDGGAGQLAVAREVLAELGLHDLCVIGIAKGPGRDAGLEHFHVPGQQPFRLEPRDPVLYFVQRLRDEAHRFAIGTHRARRSKRLGVNPLDEIAGIGPARRRALMRHFGSAKAVARAGIEDLETVAGISAETARKIYGFFHERRS